jgi:splicing factor 3B subunit 5
MFVVHAKYTGTGHADTTQYEWLVHQHRDTYASYIGHPNLLCYIALVENESMGRVRFNLMEVSLQSYFMKGEKGFFLIV